MGALDGMSVVVTGASSGIGEAIARRFVSEGALVVIGSRSEPDVAGTTWVPTDVAHPSEADALIAAAVEDHGRLDVLVNNAGVQVVNTLADTTDGKFDHVMGVNVRGVFNCCRAAIRRMCHHGGGSIINIGSVAGEVADHSMAVYNASKGAVHALTRSTAIDHGGDGVRCTEPDRRVRRAWPGRWPSNRSGRTNGTATRSPRACSTLTRQPRSGRLLRFGLSG